MKRNIKNYQLNGWRKIAVWSFGLVWLILPIWLTSAQDTPVQDFDTGKVEVVGDEPRAPESLITLLPYGASGFRYQILPPAAPTPVGFEQPNYDDASWVQGAAAFGALPRCTAPTTLQTDWAINTRLVTRKKFIVPPGAVNVRVTYIVDNDMEKFWFNGTLVDQNQVHDGCPELDFRTVTIPNNLLVAGENTLAFQTLDRGQQTYFDVKVVATTNDPEPGQCAIISPTPIAWWNGQNNANDIVNGHNGYALNGVQYGAGKVGQAFTFDGVNEVMIPTNANLNANVFSLSVWVNPSQIDADFTRVISKSGSYAIELLANGSLVYYIAGASGLPGDYNNGRTYGGATIPLNQWTHVALIYDGSRVKTFTNGVLRRQITGVSGNVSNFNTTFSIGSEQGLTGTAKFDGKIDEVQYFNRALSDSEVSSISVADNAGICPPPPRPTPSCVTAPANLISLWKAEGNAKDAAGGNLGYALGNTTYSQGKVGQSFKFDGTTEVAIPSYGILTQPTFTVGAWVNPSQIDADFTRVISKSGSYAIELLANGSLTYYIAGASGLPGDYNNGRTYGGATIPLNQWTHVALTYDGSRARTYINGRIARTITGVSGNVSNFNTTFSIGSEQGLTGTQKFDGKIDEVLFAGRALTESELTGIVDAENQGICALPISPTPTCSTPPTNFISWWRGEGNANDALGSNNGVATNTVTYSSGKVGQSFNFDGTNQVIVPSNNNLSSPSFTVGAWVNPSQIDADFTRVISKSGSYAIELLANGSLTYYIAGASGLPGDYNNGRTYGGATIPLNQWTHVAITYDGSRARTYINGRVSREIVGLTGNVAVNTSTFVIGSEQGLTGTAKFDGKIDEVQYFGRALTPTEMRTIYDSDNQGICGGVSANRTKFDFDGDGKADVSVFRPSDRVWYLNRSTAGFTSVQWGISTDKIVPADYDGDGKADVAVFRDGVWYILRSSDSSFAIANWGLAGDIPFPADYDGDGKADIAVFRPSDGTWYVFRSRDGVLTVQFGTAADNPVAADYDGDGKADFAVRRGSGGKDGVWYISNSSDGSVRIIPFGFSDDLPVQADYDGDGKTDIAVFRNGIWYIAQSRDGFKSIQFGLASDIPTAADYDGDGKSDIAIFRGGTWYLLQSTNGVSIQQFGLAADKPVPAAFVP